MNASFSGWRRKAALLSLVATALLLLAYHHRPEIWLIRFVTFVLAACLVLAIHKHRWLWYGVVVLSLSIATFQSWIEGERFWATLYALTVAFGLVQICRKTRQFRDAKHWPLTKGGFSGNYADGGDRVIYYGYKVGDSYYSGFVVAGSTLTRGLNSRLDELKGKPAFIRYKPDQPKISTLFQADQLGSTP